MPRAVFNAPFHWHPRPAVTIAYRPGGEYQVTERCRDEAKRQGKLTPPARARKDNGDAERR